MINGHIEDMLEFKAAAVAAVKAFKGVPSLLDSASSLTEALPLLRRSLFLSLSPTVILF